LNSIFDFAVNVLNVTAGEAIRRVLFDFLNYLAGFIWFALLINVLKTKEVIQRAILCLGLSTGISFLFGFIQAFWNPGLGNTEFWIFKNQINALFTDPNALGVYLVLAIPLFAGAYLTFEKAWKPLFALIVLGGIFLIPHSGSRSGFLGVVVVFILFILFSIKIIFGLQKVKPQLFKRVLLVSALSILVLMAILTMLFSTRDSVLSRRIIQNMEVLTQSNSLDIILHGRQQFWDSSRHMIKEFPVSGTGIGTYTVELPNYYLEHAIVPIMTSSYYRNVRPAGVQVDTAGNFYLQVASELGIVGLFFYVWIFFLILKMIVSANFRKNSGSEWRFLKTGLSLGIFAMLLIFIFGVHTLSFEIQLTFWLCVGLLASVSSDRMFDSKPGRKPKIVVGVIVIIFVFFYSWSTFHDLSIRARTKKLRLQQTFGFYPTERSEQRGAFRWSTQTAGIPLTVKSPILTIPILASHPDIAENPVRLEVSLTKNLLRSQRRLKEIVLDRAEWQNVVFDLAEDTGEDVLLVFEVSRTWNPQKETGALDSRDLGIAVGTMMFDEQALSSNRITDIPKEPMKAFEQIDWQGRQKGLLRRTGKSWIDVNLPPGRYRFKLWVQGQKAGVEWPYMVVWVDDEMAGETWVASDVMAPYTFCKTLKKGSRRFGAAFMNDYYEGINMDRNLFLGRLAIFKID
jgi:O-antigen ligase